MRNDKKKKKKKKKKMKEKKMNGCIKDVLRSTR
jgi:hypothetical protein